MSAASVPTVARGRAAAVGVAAVVLGGGAGELVGALVGTSPVAAVGGALIDLAPPWGKDLAIALFGTGDKAALVVAVAIVLLAVGAGAGLLARRSPVGAIAVLAVAGAIGVAASLTRADAGPLAFAPALVGAVVAVGALGVLLPRAESARDGTDRRAFLAWTGGATVLGALGAAGGWAVSSGARAAHAVRDAIVLPPASVTASVPAGAELGLAHLSPVITPNADFYRIDTAIAVPQLDPSSWRLRIHGLVDREVTLTWDELLALPLEESVTTLTCVSNEVGGDLIGTALWLGYPIRHLLAQAGVQAGADMVLSTSSDGFTAGTPLEALTDERNAILAVGMNGDPLPAEHGFPVRMVVPGLYGYVSATKWVTELEVTRFADAEGYWTPRGWSALGPIKLASRIDVPRRNANLEAGDTVIAGVAWQQHVGVAGVQVLIEPLTPGAAVGASGAAWQDAQLATSISDDTWVQWMLPWSPAAGQYTIAARAVGRDGHPQTQTQAPPAPDGATGWPSIRVTVA
ncbi:molybdopterin-dependent oxidoreductase [uncultured Microbacterium sp.]|uniref:molybdopterin-dependent oxidoreductase n=1 Tax=uncultured Microbacterium sp. TaxID=191216 RepID=UPI0025F726BD|nr:molybdopterin-dependent oxidoreductase [uncultured Microbacterium sp.]